jgi:hypothetical protein
MNLQHVRRQFLYRERVLNLCQTYVFYLVQVVLLKFLWTGDFFSYRWSVVIATSGTSYNPT